MNKGYYKFIPIALLVLSLGACTDENGLRHDVPDMSGNEVNFSLNVSKKTRTYYGGASWNANASDASIFWGDPFKNEGEEVIIYGKYAGRNVGHYTVTGFGTPSKDNLDGGNNVATTLTKKGEMGVQWGEKPADASTPVTFFSVYPAHHGQYMNDGDPANGILRTQLIPLQSPVAYSVDNDDLQPTTMPAQVRTIDAYPDMKGAVMVAKNDQVQYGAESVSLNYQVIPSVLDVTINGPTHELLNAEKADHVDIYSVRISSKDNTPIAGVFDYNIDTNTPTVVNGNTTITLQFGTQITNGHITSIVYPRLYNHSSTATTASAADVDKLRFRAFLLPNVSPTKLNIYVETSFGYYQLDGDKLLEHNDNISFVPGQIHRMKLPLLDTEGRHDFNYSNWMEQIDPTVYATELSLPGSWSSFQLVSGANNSTKVEDDATGFQVSDYLDQYAKGVRAFVLRVEGFNQPGGNRTPSQSDSGPQLRVQTGWNLHRWSSYSTYSLNDVLNALGAKIKGTKEFVVLILRGAGTPGYSNFALVYNTLKANQYVYQKEISSSTTVGDLAGSIVVKINVQNDFPTQTDFPALLGEWTAGTNATTRSVPLDWGTWTQGTTGSLDKLGNTGLKWCFSECDNVQFETFTNNTTYPNVATVAEREQAVDSYIEKSLQEYNAGDHNIWMYLLIGGNKATYKDATNYTATNCAAEVATALNTYTYQKLSTAGRSACPMGIVMMNFASSTNAAYNSQNLIRTIINNNNAFVMQKKGGTTTNPGGTTEQASYTSIENGGSAISPKRSRR